MAAGPAAATSALATRPTGAPLRGDGIDRAAQFRSGRDKRTGEPAPSADAAETIGAAVFE